MRSNGGYCNVVNADGLARSLETMVAHPDEVD